MITVINLTNPIKELENVIGNYEEIKKVIQLVDATHFSIPNNQEIIIYKDNKVVLACSYNSYYDKIYITSAYNRNKEKVFEYEIDYDMYDEVEIQEIGDPNIILNQIGGNKFIAMTGSKIYGGYDDNGYAFITIKLQKNNSKARYLEIKYNVSDLYDMKFTRVYKSKSIEVETYNDVYGDMLQDIFTKVTGMYTSL